MVRMQSDKDRDKYLNQIYGGSPPSMDYYRQLGATKARNIAARKAAEKAEREREAAVKKAEKEREKAAEKAEKEAEKQKEMDELRDLVGLGRPGAAPPPSSPSSASPASITRNAVQPVKRQDKEGFFSGLLGLGKDVASNVAHVGATAAKGIGQLGKVAFTDYTMKDMREDTKKQAEVNKQKFTPYSDQHSSGLSKEVHRAFDRAGSTATFGMLEDSRRNLDLGTSAFEQRSGKGAAADVVYDLLGSLAPGGAIVKGMQGTKMAAQLAPGMTRAAKIGQRAKEGAIAGGIYASADAGVSEALDPNRRDWKDHAKNIGMETAFGAIADPALGGLFDLVGRRAASTLGRGLDLPTAPRELAQPPQRTPDVRNVLADPIVPDTSLPRQYQSPGSYNPELQFNTKQLVDFTDTPDVRKSKLDEILPQKQQIEQQINQTKESFIDDILDTYGVDRTPERQIIEADAEWQNIKKQRQEYKEVLARTEKFTIPQELAEEYRNIIPRSFIDKSSSIDIYKAAEMAGFSGDPQGVDEFAHYLRTLQESTTLRKLDVTPDIDPKALEELEKAKEMAELLFQDSDEFQSLKAVLDTFDADIAALQGPSSQFKVDVTANQPDVTNPLDELMTLRNQQIDATKPKAPETRQPESTEGEWNPIAKREEDSFFDKIRGIPKKLKDVKDRVKYELVSEFQPIKDIEKMLAKMDADNVLSRTPHGDIDIMDSLYKGLRNASRASRIAAESIERGYAPILEILNKAKISRDDFQMFAFAKHAEDILTKNADKANRAKEIVQQIMDEGQSDQLLKEFEALEQYVLPEGTTMDKVQEVIQKWDGNEDMTKAQQMFVKEQRKDLEMLQESGRYTEKQIKAMLDEHPNYVSMRRHVEELSEVRMGRGTSSTKSRVGEPFKKRKQGSEDQVEDLMESAMQNRIRAIDTSLKNDALKKVEKLMEVDGAEQFFRQVDDKTPHFSELNKITFFRDGEEVHYQVSDELARMFSNMETRGSDNAAMKVLEKMAVFSKKGMTHYNPTFLVKSPVRDTINALFTSRTGMTPIDVMSGFLDAAVGDKLSALTGGRFKSYNDVFKEMGGDFSSYISMDINDLTRVQKSMESGKVGKGFEVLNPFKMLEKFGAAMERAPRLAEFRSAKKRGYSDEGAIFEATDVIDYSDLGNTIKKLNKISPYLGATVRGNIRVLQAIKENPGKAMTRGAVGITLPTMGLYAMRFHDNVTDNQRAKMQSQPDWQKNLYWTIPDLEEGSDKLYLVPKGFLVTQMFANPVERALDQVFGPEPKTGDKLAKETLEDFKTALMPPTAIAGWTTLQEVFRNHDDFLDIPIESEEMQKKPKSERYDSYTSELAKVAGKMMGLSPAKLDYFIKGTTGGLGSDVLDLTDNLAQQAGVDRPAKIRTNEEILNPFTQFEFDNRSSSKYSGELYEASQKEANAKSSIRSDFKEQTGMTMPSDDRGKSEVNQYHDLFRNINREIKAVREDRQMTSQQKKDEISRLRDEQRDLGVRLNEQGTITNQDQSIQEMESYLGVLGRDAVPTKTDVRDVLEQEMLQRGVDRQKLDILLTRLDKDQMTELLKQLRQ